MNLVLTRKINPAKVFDRVLLLANDAECYGAVNERRAIKTLLRV